MKNTYSKILLQFIPNSYGLSKNKCKYKGLNY